MNIITSECLILQLQTVLTAYYEDINGVQEASCCPRTKVVKHSLVDKEDTRTTPDKDTAADHAGKPAADEVRGH